MSDYETDILLWSERQATLLRRLAAGDRVNDQIDWENVAEEIDSVGREQLHAVESLILQALIHRLKILAWPNALDVPHWRSEEAVFMAQARRRFVPSMRQRLDLPGIYTDALKVVRHERIDGQSPGPLPQECPATLDDLLSGRD